MGTLNLAKAQVAGAALAVLFFIGCATVYLVRVDFLSQNPSWLYTPQSSDNISHNITTFGLERPNGTVISKRHAMTKLQLENDLLSILEKTSAATVRAMPNKTVIITIVNEAWAAPGSVLEVFFQIFAASEHALHYLNRLIIVAVDPSAYRRCKIVHFHCYFLETKGLNFTQEQVYMTEGFLKLQWRKIGFLREVLELGYSFLFTDLDVMWMRDPLPYLLEHRDSDIVFSPEYYYGNQDDNRNVANTGLYYAKANNKTIAFYKHWYESREKFPNRNDQEVLAYIRNDEVVKALGINFWVLDPELFVGFHQSGRPKSSRDFNKLQTVHANRCNGLQKKLPHVKLLLESWLNFTSYTPEEKAFAGTLLFTLLKECG